MKRIFTLVVVVMMLACILLPGFTACAEAWSEVGTSAPQLKTLGNEIVNAETNEEVLLRGVNVPSLATWPVNEHITESLEEVFNNWNANVVRFPVNLTCWNGEYEDNYGYSQNGDPTGYKELIKDTVRRVMAAGKYIIIDLHEFNNFNDRMKDFWAEVAADPLYQNNPSVIFNLMNEPTCSAEEVVSGNQTLIEVVRDAGAKNLIMCGGIDWAYDLRPYLTNPLVDKGSDSAGGTALAGYGIVYDTHIYPMKGDVSSWEDRVGQLRKIAPVFVGEFGWDSSDSTVTGNTQDIYNGYIPKILDWMDESEEMPAIGWTAWCLHPASTPKLITSWDFTPTYYFGRFIKNKLTGQEPMEPVPGDANVLFDLNDLTKTNGAAGYWTNCRFDVTVEAEGGYQGAQAFKVDHYWGDNALWGGFSAHSIPSGGYDMTGGKYISFLLKGDGNPQRVEISFSGKFGSSSVSIHLAENDTDWHQYIYSFAELGIMPEYGTFSEAVQTMNLNAGETGGAGPGVYYLSNFRITAEKPAFEGVAQPEKTLISKMDDTDLFTWQEGGIAKSVAANYSGKVAKLTYTGDTGKWIQASINNDVSEMDRLLFMANAESPQNLRVVLVDKLGYEAGCDITIDAGWNAYSMDIREFLIHGAPILPSRITAIKFYNQTADGAVLLSEIGFANQAVQMDVPVYDETDYNAYNGVVPKDPQTGEILFTSTGNDRIHYAEDGENAWRVSLADGVAKNSYFKDLFAGTNAGDFAIAAPLQTYTEENGYIQFDFGTNVTLDQLQVSFANSTDVNNYNYVPKKYRVDYSVDGINWTKGTVQSNDFSKAEDVGKSAAEVYARIETATDLEKSMLPSSISYLFETRFTGRYFRFVILVPTQDDGVTMPPENKLTIRGISWFDLVGLEDVNQLSEDAEVPLNPYNGMVEFKMARSESNPDFDDNSVVRLSNEEIMPPDAIRTSRASYSAPGGTDWYLRHIFASDNYHQNFGLRGSAADYAKGNVWLQIDMGKNTNIDQICISSFNQGSTFTPVYTEFNKLPKRLRVDTGVVDEFGRLKWTKGEEIEYDLSNPESVGVEVAAAYQLIKDLDPSTYSTIDAKGDERTPEEQAQWEAYRKIPTISEIHLDASTFARYYKVVILEPTQEPISETGNYQFDFYNIRYINSTKAAITNSWDSARLVKNVYGSGVVSSPDSMFDGETNFTNNEGADKAFDSSSSTQWFNGNRNYKETSENGLAEKGKAWIVIDLGQVYHITGYRLICNNTGYRPVDYRLQSGVLEETAAGATHAEQGLNIITQEFQDEVVQTYPENTASVDLDSVRSGDCNFTARYVRLYIDVTRRWADPTTDNPDRMSTDGNTTINGICLYGTPYEEVPEEPVFQVTDVKVTSEDGTDMKTEGLTAGGGMVTVSVLNTTENEELPVWAIAALYNETTDQMEYFWSNMGNIPSASLPAAIQVPVDIPADLNLAEYRLKVFVWNSPDNARPFDENYTVVQIDDDGIIS